VRAANLVRSLRYLLAASCLFALVAIRREAALPPGLTGPDRDFRNAPLRIRQTATNLFAWEYCSHPPAYMCSKACRLGWNRADAFVLRGRLDLKLLSPGTEDRLNGASVRQEGRAQAHIHRRHDDEKWNGMEH